MSQCLVQSQPDSRVLLQQLLEQILASIRVVLPARQIELKRLVDCHLDGLSLRLVVKGQRT